MTCPRCETVMADGKCLNCGYPKPEQADTDALLNRCRAVIAMYDAAAPTTAAREAIRDIDAYLKGEAR